MVGSAPSKIIFKSLIERIPPYHQNQPQGTNLGADFVLSQRLLLMIEQRNIYSINVIDFIDNEKLHNEVELAARRNSIAGTR